MGNRQRRVGTGAGLRQQAPASVALPGAGQLTLLVLTRDDYHPLPSPHPASPLGTEVKSHFVLKKPVS